MSLVDIVRNSKITKLFFGSLLFLQLLTTSPIIPTSIAQTDPKKQTRVYVDNLPYFIDGNIVINFKREPEKNRQTVKKAFITKGIFDRITKEDLKEQYLLFKVEKEGINLSLGIGQIISIETKLLEGIITGKEDIILGLGMSYLVDSLKEFPKRIKQNGLQFVFNQYEKMESVMKDNLRIKDFALRNKTLSYWQAIQFLKNREFKRIYNQPTFNLYRRIQNQEIGFDIWAREFNDKISVILKPDTADKVKKIIEALRDYIIRQEPYHLFSIELKENEEKARIKRDELKEKIKSLVDHHFLYLSPKGHYQMQYDLVCVDKVGFKKLYFEVLHIDYWKREKSKSIKDSMERGMSFEEAERDYEKSMKDAMDELDQHEKEIRDHIDSLCKKIGKPIIDIKRVMNKGDYILVDVTHNIEMDVKEPRITKYIEILKKSGGFWKHYHRLNSYENEEYMRELWSEGIKMLEEISP